MGLPEVETAQHTEAGQRQDMGTDAAGGRRGRTRRGARLVGVAGELLITLGVLVALYAVWELWWTNLEAGRVQDAAVERLAEDFGAGSDGTEPAPAAGLAPVTPAAEDGEAFGILYVPRFGEGYARPIAEGVGHEVLNSAGIGHYPGTQWPGEPGNFAVAGHRQSHGQVFWDMDRLRPGDRLYVQTETGYYTYRHTGTEIVQPSESSVLLPVPHRPEAEPTVSTLTLTTCHPPFTVRERMIAYAELESWRPLSDGPPAEIAAAAGADAAPAAG